MPIHDGTGPLGHGPGTGRQRGRCKTGFGVGDIGHGAFGGKNRWLFGLIVPLVVAVIRDLASPTGFLRQRFSEFLPGKRMNDPHKICRDAQYSILDNQSPEPDQKKEADHDTTTTRNE